METEFVNMHDDRFLLWNNPELAKIFAREDVQEFVKRILFDIEENSFKTFIKKGYDKFYKEEIIDQLRQSYEIIESENIDGDIVISKLRRAFDGKEFVLDQEVMHFGTRARIARMYVRDQDEHVNIKLVYDHHMMTWSQLKDL